MKQPTSSKKNTFRGKRVLVVGLGLHGGGAATVRWLLQQGATVCVTDQKTKTELQSTLRAFRGRQITWRLGGYSGVDWSWPDHIIINPAVNLAVPANQPIVAAMKRRVPVDNEASLFVRLFAGTLIGVTGTRGKTTTTLLLGAMAKLAHRQTIVSGNVRDVAMLDHLPRLKKNSWAVLELSSFQLERLPVAPVSFRVAVLTNLKVDHLNRHGTMRVYGATKCNIFQGQHGQDVAVLNADDPYSQTAARAGHGQRMWFGQKVPATGRAVTIRGGYVVERQGKTWVKLFPRLAWTLPGDHNVMNMLAAVAAARALDIAPRVIVRAVRAFRSVPYRQEITRRWRGHDFINDTAATSPDGALAAMQVYPRGVYIVGGTDKQLHMAPLAKALAATKRPFVTLPGTATDKLMASLPAAAAHLAHPTNSMRQAVRTALRLAQPTQPIVLTPGAASFGLFIHEFDRGDVFRREVRRLP